MSLLTYEKGEWGEAPEDMFIFPTGLADEAWKREFCEVNHLIHTNCLGNGEVSGVDLYRSLSDTDVYFPYIAIFDWLGEQDVILCKKWYDIMHFINSHCLVCNTRDLELIRWAVDDILEVCSRGGHRAP